MDLNCLEGNFLVRKRCHHTNTLDCDCDHLDFDVLLMDYDYVHTERTEIQDPTHTGTYHYRALPLLVCTMSCVYVSRHACIACIHVCIGLCKEIFINTAY